MPLRRAPEVSLTQPIVFGLEESVKKPKKRKRKPKQGSQDIVNELARITAKVV